MRFFIDSYYSSHTFIGPDGFLEALPMTGCKVQLADSISYVSSFIAQDRPKVTGFCVLEAPRYLNGGFLATDRVIYKANVIV